MSNILQRYEDWGGEGPHQATGNAKQAGVFGVNYFDDSFVLGFTVGKQQGQTDIKIDRVEAGDVPSLQISGNKYGPGTPYSDTISR